MWLSLAHVQMHAYPNCDAMAIGRTAEAALYLGRSHMDISKVIYMLLTTSLSSFMRQEKTWLTGSFFLRFNRLSV